MISLPVSLSCCCVINWTNRQTFKIKLFFKWNQKTLKTLSQWHHIQLFCLSLLQTTIKKHKRPSWTHVLSAGSRGSSKARKSGPALIRLSQIFPLIFTPGGRSIPDPKRSSSSDFQWAQRRWLCVWILSLCSSLHGGVWASCQVPEPVQCF